MKLKPNQLILGTPKQHDPGLWELDVVMDGQGRRDFLFYSYNRTCNGLVTLSEGQYILIKRDTGHICRGYFTGASNDNIGDAKFTVVDMHQFPTWQEGVRFYVRDVQITFLAYFLPDVLATDQPVANTPKPVNRTVKRFLISQMGPARTKAFIEHVEGMYVVFTRVGPVQLPVEPKDLYRRWASYRRSELRDHGGYNDNGFGYIPSFQTDEEPNYA